MLAIGIVALAVGYIAGRRSLRGRIEATDRALEIETQTSEQYREAFYAARRQLTRGRKEVS